MNAEWKKTLSSSGASFNDREFAEFAAPYDPEGKSHLFDLARRSLIKVTGKDAATFLHGQFSNDLQSLDGSNSQLSSYSSPKGRVLALFRIFKADHAYYLDLPAEVKDAFAKRLQMFVMRSDVRIEDLGATWVSLGLSGEGAEQLLCVAGFTVPAEINTCCSQTGVNIVIVRVPGLLPRFVLHGAVTQMQALWAKLAQSAEPVSSQFWNLQQIQAGIPEVYASTQERFVAQMLNLQIIGGVNFKKGCYPGQEVIARLQYLGRLKRRMYRLATVGTIPPAPGTPIVSEGVQQVVGEVIDSAVTQDQDIEMLAVLKTEVAEDRGKQLYLEGRAGEPVRLLELPYALDGS